MPDSVPGTLNYSGFPRGIRSALERNAALQTVAEKAKQAAEVQRAKTIRALNKANMSRGDVAELLGLSHQRLDQILRG